MLHGPHRDGTYFSTSAQAGYGRSSMCIATAYWLSVFSEGDWVVACLCSHVSNLASLAAVRRIARHDVAAPLRANPRHLGPFGSGWLGIGAGVSRMLGTSYPCAQLAAVLSYELRCA